MTTITIATTDAHLEGILALQRSNHLNAVSSEVQDRKQPGYRRASTIARQRAARNATSTGSFDSIHEPPMQATLGSAR
jgi:hypothetical protein